MTPRKEVIVHLASTNHTESLMEEIRVSYTVLFEAVSWKYLEQYSREIFNCVPGNGSGIPALRDYWAKSV
jgi:hypothetical protein